MVGFSFDQIGEGKTMKLTQLAPVGYEDVAYFLAKARKGVKTGMFTLTVLDNGGGTAVDKDGNAMQWSFARTYDVDNAKWLDDAHWVRTSDKVTITTENDVIFDSGDGLWFYVSATAYTNVSDPNKYKLANAGEAILESRSILIRKGNKGVAVPLSAPVKLTQLAPNGYEDVAYFLAKARKGVKTGMFTVTVLDNGGGTAVDKDGNAMQWSFAHTYDVDNAKWLDDAHWVRTSDKVSITSENDVIFNPGDGLWVYVSATAYTNVSNPDKYTLQFPGIEDED